MQYDVLTIGGATQDIFVTSDAFAIIKSPRFATGLGECLTLGSKIPVENVTVATGGGALNAAVTFSRLGNKVGIHTTVGHDDFSRSIQKTLSDERIAETYVKTHPNLGTGLSILLTAEGGERSALVHRGAAGQYQKKDFTAKTLSANWLYITSLGGNLDVLEHIVDIAHKKSLRIALNPGSDELRQGTDLRDILPKVTLLLLNKEEAKQLTLRPANTCAELARSLARYCPYTIVTDGENGAWGCEQNTIYEVTPTRVKSISQTGAGDAFGSGTVCGLMRELSLPEAMKVGALNAASVVTQLGAHTGALSSWPKSTDLDRIHVQHA